MPRYKDATRVASGLFVVLEELAKAQGPQALVRWNALKVHGAEFGNSLYHAAGQAGEGTARAAAATASAATASADSVRRAAEDYAGSAKTTVEAEFQHPKMAGVPPVCLPPHPIKTDHVPKGPSRVAEDAKESAGAQGRLTDYTSIRGTSSSASYVDRPVEEKKSSSSTTDPTAPSALSPSWSRPSVPPSSTTVSPPPPPAPPTEQTTKMAGVEGKVAKPKLKPKRPLAELPTYVPDMSDLNSEEEDKVSSGASPSSGFAKNARARAVPSSPLARVFGFGTLAAGLAVGTVAEAMRRGMGQGGSGGGGGGRSGGSEDGAGQRQGGNGGGGAGVKQYVLSDANAERLAESLCRMRGAALKLGQMLSIQDEGIIPPQLAKALDRVRSGADMMPPQQLETQMKESLGVDWRQKLLEFEETPVAAASIGQVHRAKLLDGTVVAMKVQYPGVADSIDSDLRNLERLVTLTNIMPPGLFVEEIVEVAREELSLECDYTLEAANQQRFARLVEGDPVLSQWVQVPKVVPELVGKRILTTQFVEGIHIDQVAKMSQEVRNHVARLVLRLTMEELFTWRFMQTDPNWGNFLFDRKTGKLFLIDFGACRQYSDGFVSGYLKLVWSAANRDSATMLEVSKTLGFLTGDESPAMTQAHELAGLVVGEPFVGHEPFDFYGSEITGRLSRYSDVFMKHRLTPPPREVYSLHRKLAGAFLICIKLQARIACRDILEDVYAKRADGNGRSGDGT